MRTTTKDYFRLSKFLILVLIISTLFIPNTVSAIIPYETTFIFEQEAEYLRDLGVFLGKSKETFVPALGDQLTRQEGMKLLSDIFSWSIDGDAKSGFSDVSSWAEPYVKVALDHGVTNGIGNGKFGGQDNVTYAEFYTWILRELGESNIYSNNDETWFNNVKELATSKRFFFNEITNGTNAINRDYAVGILHDVLPLSPDGETLSFYDKIEEAKTKVTSPSASSIVPVSAFTKNNQTQVKLKDSKELIIILDNYVGNPMSVEVAMCGKNLCNLMISDIRSTDTLGKYIVTLPNELEVGVTYYISSLVLTEANSNTTITDIADNEFTVVNNDTDPHGSLIIINDRSELDNYIAYSSQPLAIDFYANWCGPCVRLAPIYEEASIILDGEISMLKVNTDVININGFGVKGIPNQQFYYNGKKTGEKIGYTAMTGAEYALLVQGYFVD